MTPSAHPDHTAPHTRLYAFVSAIMIIFFIGHVIDTVLTNFSPYSQPYDFKFSEFFISYQGGFVRRGLMGELLYTFCRATGLNPIPVIITFCSAVFALTLFFFLRLFRRRGLCFWLLLSPMVFGYTSDIIRKDYLSYLLILGIFYLLTHHRSIAGMLGATLLMVLGIFIHEAFIFYGVPLAALLMLRQNRSWAWLGIVAPLAAFTLMSLFKGSAQIAQSIFNSWNTLFPGVIENTTENSVGALTWETLYAMKKHIIMNFHSGEGWTGPFYRLPFMLLAYYFITNFLHTFSRGGHSGSAVAPLNMGLLYLFSLICLAPMFLFLSCDYARLYQYAAVATLTTVLFVPSHTVPTLFPRFFINFVQRLNQLLSRILVPTKGLMLTMLIFMAPLPVAFKPLMLMHQSVAFFYYNLPAWLHSLLTHVI